MLQSSREREYSPFEPAAERATPLDRLAERVQTLGLLWLMVCFGLLLFSQLAKADSQDPRQAQAGILYFNHADGTRQRMLPVSSHLDLDIQGMSARGRFHQSFSNHSDQWLEAVYVFPLPDNSAINFMRMYIGEREITGQIRERAAARADYQAALREGRRAALTEQERPNLFTQSIANIPPGETVRIELHYVQRVHYDAGQFRVQFPMTLTPRYIPGAPLDAAADPASTRAWASATAPVPDAARITPRYLAAGDLPAHNPITLNLRLQAGAPLATVTSASHALAVRRVAGDQTRHDIEFAHTAVAMDRDFELQWQLQSGSEPLAAVFHEQFDGQSYVQLLFLPPQPDTITRAPARELLLVIDTSGSMAGTSIAQAREGLLLALERLAPGDRFNVIEFNSGARALFPEPVQADRHNVHQAMRFVKQLQAGGGTEMIPALRLALHAPASGFLQQVVFITDGSVGNEQQVLHFIAQHLGQARLFTVGIGSAPNQFFLRKAAQIGRGSHTSIGSLQQVRERMAGLFHKLENPALTGLEVHWPVAAEAVPASVPDLYLGEPLVVQARLQAPLVRGDSIRVRGVLEGRAWERRLPIPPAPVETTEGVPPVVSLWARANIDALLDSALGRSNDDSVRAQVLPLALRYQLLSPYTSFVAVETQVSRPANTDVRQAPVLNQLPAGQQAAAVVYPQGATAAGVHILLGVLALLLVLGLCAVRGANRAAR